MKTILLFTTVLTTALAFAQDPYHLLDSPQPFRGPETQTADVSHLKTVRIGLFAPDGSSNQVARSLIQGVSLAIEEANAKGGVQGVPFEIVRRWADDPWMAGSKEVIHLVVQERVWVIIGSIDGASTHVAEQVVTKMWLPLISPVSSDPSLTHINIPWMFRLPPDDQNQATLLVADGLKKHGMKKVGLLTSSDHDGRYAAKELLTALRVEGIPPLFHFQVDFQTNENSESVRSIVQRIKRFQPQALFLRLPPVPLQQVLMDMNKAGLQLPLFLPWIPGMKGEHLQQVYAGSITLLKPFDRSKQGERFTAFAQRYKSRFNELPSFVAAYAYDAGRLAVEAILQTGLNRTRLGQTIFQLRGFEGVSGRMEWDNGGGNSTRPVIRFFPPH